MLYFIAAVYNEETELFDLINHVYKYVDGIRIVDDGSEDDTPYLLQMLETENELYPESYPDYQYKIIKHTGLPETVKSEALKGVPDGSWVLMLDADERFITPISEIVAWTKSPEAEKVDYVYFNQYEVIDNIHVRTFQKSKIFRKESITFPTGIHEDDRFEGNGWGSDWEVLHRKTSNKQRVREREYIQTYKDLLNTGRIDEGRFNWLVNLHHYERG